MTIETVTNGLSCKLICKETKTLLCEITLNDNVVSNSCTQPFVLDISFDQSKKIGLWDFREPVFYCDPVKGDYVRISVCAQNSDDNNEYEFYGFVKYGENQDCNKYGTFEKAVEIISSIIQCNDVSKFAQLTTPVFVIYPKNNNSYENI